MVQGDAGQDLTVGFSLYDELARTERPPITAPVRVVYNGDYSGARQRELEREALEREREEAAKRKAHKKAVHLLLKVNGPLSQAEIAEGCQITYRQAGEALSALREERKVDRSLLTQTWEVRAAPPMTTPEIKHALVTKRRSNGA